MILTKRKEKSEKKEQKDLLINNLYLLSINHKTAPVVIREKFAISENSLNNAFQNLKSCGLNESYVILSTCNRTEIYFQSKDANSSLNKIYSFFKDYLSIEPKLVQEYSILSNGLDVVSHIFKLASGLDSLVLGEKQILSQVKYAYSVAQKENTLDDVLEKLFQSAMKAAKDVHENTDISKSSQSISSVAIDMANEICGPIKTKSVMVLGAGLMAKLALEHIEKIGGAKEVMVLNRSPHRVIEFSENYKIDKSFPFEKVYEVMNDTDVLVMAAGAPHFIVFAEQFKELRKDSNKPLYIFDISMPRNVDSEFGRLPNVKLMDIDGLQETYNKMTHANIKDLKDAEKILSKGIGGFIESISNKEIDSLIKGLKEKTENIRLEKLLKFKKNKTSFTPEELDYITKNIVNSIVHEEILNLKMLGKKK